MKCKMLNILTCVFVLVIYGMVVQADIIIDGDDNFAATVELCLEEILSVGGQTADIVKALEKSDKNHVIREGNPGVNRTDFDSDSDGHTPGGFPGLTCTGRGTGTTVNWDPNFRGSLDGVQAIPCKSLLHELSHALDADKGRCDHRQAGGTGIDKCEVDATREENRFRHAQTQKQDQRQTYNGRRLPADAIFQ